MFLLMILLLILGAAAFFGGFIFLMEGSLSGRKKFIFIGLAFISASLAAFNATADVRADIRVAELRKLADDPKAWMAGRKAESVPVALALVDGKIADLAKELEERPLEKVRPALVGAIDALSRERECLAGLKSPVRCD